VAVPLRLGVATHETIRDLQAGVSALQHRPVEIVVTGRATRVPAVSVSPEGADRGELTLSRHSGLLDQAADVPAGPGLDPSGKPRLDSGQQRRAHRLSKWRATIADGGGFLAAAGTLVPAFVVHGSPQLVLLSVGGALVGSVSLRVLNRLSGESGKS
jgi:hypothetical protein